MTAPDRDTARARVAWLSPSGDAPPSALVEAFTLAGWRLSLGPGATPVDLAVINLEGRSLSRRAVEALTSTVRRVAPECVVLFRVSAETGPSDRGHLRRSGEVVLAEAGPAALVAVGRNRLRLHNIAEEAGERLKSLAASTRLAEFPPIETSPSAPVVLVAGAPAPAALAAFSAADAVAGRIAAALTPQQAMRALDAAAFDCVVLAASGPHDPFVALARTLRTRRRWQDMPFIVVAPGALSEAAEWSASFAAEILAPAQTPDELAARVLALSRRARLSAAMRRFLAACAGDGVRDRLSGAFASSFFAAHASRLFARSDSTGRQTALLGVRLVADSREDAASARTLTDAARLLRRVTRVEDFYARIGPDTFIAVMQATSEDADRVARRIEGVVGNAMFQGGGGSPFGVSAAAVAVPRPRGERVEEAVAAVLAELVQRAPKRAER